MRDNLIRFFRIAAIVEAVTWAGLLVGMLFKYVVAHEALGARAFGYIHGMAFFAYLISVSLVRHELRWTKRTTWVALLASVPPFATFIFERWAMAHADDHPPAVAEAAKPRVEVGAGPS